MYLYKITNKINGKCYYGQTANKISPIVRWNNHKSDLRNNRHDNEYLQNAWNKYGENNFLFEIVKKVNSIKKLNRLETWYVSRNKNGYNIQSGGKNKLQSEETKQKIRIAHIGKVVTQETRNKISKGNKGKKISIESREKMRKAHLGKKNHFYGKHHTNETKEKLSKLSKARNAGNGNPMYGKKHKKKTIDKIKKTLKGKFDGTKNPFYGKRHDDKTKKIMKELAIERMKKRSKFTENDIKFIRNSLLSINELTIKYDVSYATIFNIKKFNSWKHIK